MYIPHTKQLYISRVRFLDLPQKPSSKNLPLSERMSVETREWTAQAKAEVSYQLGNDKVQSIDPLLQFAASPEEMWNIVAEICQGRAGGDNPLKPPTSITPFKCLQGLSYNERLDLITRVHSGEEMGRCKPEGRKPQNQQADSCCMAKSSEEKKSTSAIQPSPVTPVQSPQLISSPSPASLDTSMDEFFQQLPQPPSTTPVPSSNQVVCIICKHPAEKEENMEICSYVSCLAHAHQTCGHLDNGRFVCCSLHKPTNLPE